MDIREQRGLAIAAYSRIRQSAGTWIVPSQSERGKNYIVSLSQGQSHCTCQDHELTGRTCKHIHAAQIVIDREYSDDETKTEAAVCESKPKCKSYPQLWPSYNSAQCSEKAVVQLLLRDLCSTIPEPAANRLGRPRLPLRDGIFCACLKVYSMLSSRRFTSDLHDAHEKGYISRVPHFNSVLNVLDSDETASILTALVSQSAEPLAAIETNFAVDATGFSGCRFDCWNKHKWQNAEPITRRAWIKAHAVVGVATHIVTAVEVTPKEVNDGTLLQSLMYRTTERFQITDLSADKAYLSEANLQAISGIGANAYIPFKTNSVAARPGVWNNAFHYFNLHREEFLEHYHQRSNVESTFSAIKRKFGDSVKAKNDRSMKSEVLAKFVCHNLARLVQAMMQLGIDPTFGAASRNAAP